MINFLNVFSNYCNFILTFNGNVFIALYMGHYKLDLIFEIKFLPFYSREA